jgi:hypothetical protein
VRLIAQGRVEFVLPVAEPAELVPAAVAAVRQWGFRPTLRNGQPIRGTAVVDVPFGP